MTSKSMTLPERLPIDEAPALRESLLGNRFTALEIDATATQGASTLALQILVSAAAQWRIDKHPFHLRASAALYSDFATLGLLFPELTQEPSA